MINCIPFRKACTGLPEGMHLISEKCALCKRNIQKPERNFQANLRGSALAVTFKGIRKYYNFMK